MAWIVLLAVIALPVIEIALFIKSAQWMGLLPTIAIAIGAGALGIALVRRQGAGTLLKVRAQMERGEVPVNEAFDGICLALAGGLLLLPGFFSDVLAILLLLPPVRTAIRLWLASHMRHVVVAGGQPPQPTGRPPVIDGDFTVITGNDEQLPR